MCHVEFKPSVNMYRIIITLHINIFILTEETFIKMVEDFQGVDVKERSNK